MNENALALIFVPIKKVVRSKQKQAHRLNAMREYLVFVGVVFRGENYYF